MEKSFTFLTFSSLKAVFGEFLTLVRDGDLLGDIFGEIPGEIWLILLKDIFSKGQTINDWHSK